MNRQLTGNALGSLPCLDCKATLIRNLISLRQQIENDTNQSIHHLNLNAAALLDDFCRAVGLDEAQIRRILGSGYPEISPIENWPHGPPCELPARPLVFAF